MDLCDLKNNNKLGFEINLSEHRIVFINSVKAAFKVAIDLQIFLFKTPVKNKLCGKDSQLINS